MKLLEVFVDIPCTVQGKVLFIRDKFKKELASLLSDTKTNGEI